MDSGSKSNQQRRWSLPPSLMPRTLWSTESPTRDLRSSGDDHKGVNVQVVLRCRPLNEDETKARKPAVVSCDELRRQVAVTQKHIDKTFLFDKVFGPNSQQKELYDDVVGPIVNEVLEGYNWTIFAYGQTGTGKTYTMEGEGRKEKNGKFHKDAGVIPRAVQQIFEILESEKTDYIMKATYLELYNEEITDLLAAEERSLVNPLGDKPKRPLFLMEDGKGSVFVRGLEEEIVSSMREVYTILDKGSAKKHTADTLLNKQSNRSHSIFSITVQIKECDSDGSEVIKCGKLNLVDLAGSENILRSGAREVRAREAGEINKSLLTLGRVINALAENSVHVPYRDSKLTRLLRDSLGGKTKTCIIATISPSLLCQEETLSTLDYAFRAKSIKNKPEVNRKVMKSSLIKDLYTQISHLKQELRAARDEIGHYEPQDNHHDSEEAMRKQLMELQELYMYQQQLTADLKDKLDSTERELTTTRQTLFNLEDQYRQEKEINKNKETMIFNMLSSGKTLRERALELRSDLEGAALDISTLFAKIEQKNHLEDRNRNHVQNFYSQLAQQLEELDKAVSASVTMQEQNWKAIQDSTQSFLTLKNTAMDEVLKHIQYQRDLYGSGIKRLDVSAEELYQNSQSSLTRLSSELSNHSSCIINLIQKSSSDADNICNGLKINLNNLGSRIDAFVKQEQENHVRTHQTTKSISHSILNFFKTLGIYISKISLMEEDSRTITEQKMNAFTKKFEEFALGEEKLLLQQMAEILASSTSRKKKMIEAAVNDILDISSKKTERLNQEITDVQTLASDAEERWRDYIDRTRGNYVGDSVVVEIGKIILEEGLQCCTVETEIAEKRRVSEESLLDMFRRKVDSVDSLIKNARVDNEKFQARFSCVASSVLEEAEDAGKNTMLSLEYPLRLDHETSEKIDSLGAHCLKDMKGMNILHNEKVVEISGVAKRSLLDDYLVDDAAALTPRKRNFNLESKESFENLIDVPFRDSLESSQAHAVETQD